MDRKKSSGITANTTLWILGAFFIFYQYGIRSVIPNLFNENLQHYFLIDATKMGVLISLFYLSYSVMQIPSGILMDRLNPKCVSIGAFLTVALGSIAFMITNNYLIASIAQLIAGFGASFAIVLMMKISNDYFPPTKVAFVSSLALSFSSLGPVLMSPMFDYLSRIYSWKSVIFGFGILGIVVAVITYFLIDEKQLIPNQQHQQQQNQRNQQQQSSSVVSTYESVISSLKSLLSNYQLIWMGLFSMFILGAVSSFCDAWGISFIKCVYEVDKIKAASMVGLIYLGTIPGIPLCAFLSEKLKSYKIIMIWCSALLMILFTIVIFVKLNIFLLSVILFTIGIGLSCQFLVFPAALSLTPSNIAGTVSGFINTITMLGSTLLVPIIGWIIDFSKNIEINNGIYSSQDYKNGMIMILISIACSFIILCFIKDEKSKYSKEMK